ncbi:hypothetical protein [Aureivirga sp. CE67]|uniref:hypothetical protein n=1 Tax=Aureivirga sp. CE67 TaxID=1788983 RepID=UPI0018C926A9|nr:hypothetical protein [Aureivirga sp. CE67]
MKYLFLIIFSIYYHNSNAQLIVEDPLANKALAQTLMQGNEALEETKKTVHLLEENKNLLKQVSNVLRDTNITLNILKQQEYTISQSINIIEEIKNYDQFSISEIQIISRNIERLVFKTTEILQNANRIMSEGLFNMNDSERLTFLREYQKEMSSTLTDLKIIRDQYFRIAQNRALKKIFN